MSGQILNAPMWRGAAAALVCLALACLANFARTQDVPDTAPDRTPAWTLATADGGTSAMRKTGGEKTCLLLFRATWCPYCKALMPRLESLVLGHDPARFEVLAITLGEDGDPAAFLAGHTV